MSKTLKSGPHYSANLQKWATAAILCVQMWWHCVDHCTMVCFVYIWSDDINQKPSFSRSLNVSTNLITAMGCQQCLLLSVVQLKGKQWVLSPRRLASIDLGSKTKRKINPVQILHRIGLNRHSAIHPWMWRECWAHKELCKYGFQIVRQVRNTTTPPLNKQGKQCWKPHCRNGVVDTLGPDDIFEKFTYVHCTVLRSILQFHRH